MTMSCARWKSLLMAALLFLVTATAMGGHGFMTAFGNIEWLPEPGQTPDQTWYAADLIQEAASLWAADTPNERLKLSLQFAREKLAELEAMLMSENSDAAKTAIDQYWNYLGRAKDSIPPHKERKQQEVAEMTETLTNHILEHQYILTIIFYDLPVPLRTPLKVFFRESQKFYPTVADQMPRKKRGSLFFKEEEVRWAIEMAMRDNGQDG